MALPDATKNRGARGPSVPLSAPPERRTQTPAVTSWACARCKRPVEGPHGVPAEVGLTVVCPACREMTANKETLRCARCGCVLSTVGAWWKDGKPLCRPCEATGSLPAGPRSEPAPVRAADPQAPKAPSASRFVARFEPHAARSKGHPVALAGGVALLLAIAIAGKIALARSGPSAAPSSSTEAQSGGNPGTAVPSSPGIASDPAVRTERQRDRDGRLTLVSGPDPMSTLKALCDSNVSGGLRPIAVGVGSSSESRVGFVRLTARDGALATIVIQKDPRQHLWTIGNGLVPIQLSGTSDAVTR